MDLRLFLSCGSSRWLDILSLGFFFLSVSFSSQLFQGGWGGRGGGGCTRDETVTYDLLV